MDSALVRTPRHPVPAVVTAMNLNGLGVARALGRHGVRVIGVHSGPPVPELRTRFLREVWDTEPGPAALIATLIERAAGLGERPVLLPITDESVQAIAENRAAIERHYRLALPASETVLALLSKKGIDAAANEHGVRVPATWVVEVPDQLERLAPDLPYPCILKPQNKSAEFSAAGGRKAAVYDDAAALLSAYRGFCAVEPRVVVQQFIPGGDGDVWFCLACADARGELLGAFTGRKIRQWPPYCGGTAAAEPVDAPEIEAITRDFFRRVAMRGPCSIEFKRDPRDGTFYMIEPTVGRTDWQNAIADNCGVPLAYLAYCDAAGVPIPELRPTRIRWRWMHFAADRLSAHHYRRRGELGRLAWLWSVRPPLRTAYLAFDDPAPFLSIARSTARRIVAKLLRRRTAAGDRPARMPST